MPQKLIADDFESVFHCAPRGSTGVTAPTHAQPGGVYLAAQPTLWALHKYSKAAKRGDLSLNHDAALEAIATLDGLHDSSPVRWGVDMHCDVDRPSPMIELAEGYMGVLSRLKDLRQRVVATHDANRVKSPLSPGSSTRPSASPSSSRSSSHSKHHRQSASGKRSKHKKKSRGVGEESRTTVPDPLTALSVQIAREAIEAIGDRERRTTGLYEELTKMPGRWYNEIFALGQQAPKGAGLPDEVYTAMTGSIKAVFRRLLPYLVEETEAERELVQVCQKVYKDATDLYPCLGHEMAVDLAKTSRAVEVLERSIAARHMGLDVLASEDEGMAAHILNSTAGAVDSKGKKVDKGNSVPDVPTLTVGNADVSLRPTSPPFPEVWRDCFNKHVAAWRFFHPPSTHADAEARTAADSPGISQRRNPGQPSTADATKDLAAASRLADKNARGLMAEMEREERNKTASAHARAERAERGQLAHAAAQAAIDAERRQSTAEKAMSSAGSSRTGAHPTASTRSSAIASAPLGADSLTLQRALFAHSPDFDPHEHHTGDTDMSGWLIVRPHLRPRSPLAPRIETAELTGKTLGELVLRQRRIAARDKRVGLRYIQSRNLDVGSKVSYAEYLAKMNSGGAMSSSRHGEGGDTQGQDSTGSTATGTGMGTETGHAEVVRAWGGATAGLLFSACDFPNHSRAAGGSSVRYGTYGRLRDTSLFAFPPLGASGDHGDTATLLRNEGIPYQYQYTDPHRSYFGGSHGHPPLYAPSSAWMPFPAHTYANAYSTSLYGNQYPHAPLPLPIPPPHLPTPMPMPMPMPMFSNPYSQPYPFPADQPFHNASFGSWSSQHPLNTWDQDTLAHAELDPGVHSYSITHGDHDDRITDADLAFPASEQSVLTEASPTTLALARPRPRRYSAPPMGQRPDWARRGVGEWDTGDGDGYDGADGADGVNQHEDDVGDEDGAV